MNEPTGQRTGRPTLRDVAAVAGVDPSAVSRLVNDDPNLSVSDATRQRIIDAIEELDYRPNMMARGLRMARTWTIGLVLPALRNPMYVHIIRGAQARAVEAKYGIVLGSQVEAQTETTFARLLTQRRVDGLLVASATLDDDFIRSLLNEDAGPVVLVNRHVTGIDSSVIVDDVAGSRLATEHLLALGHQDIVALVGPSDIDTSIRRQQGFEEAMEGAGSGVPRVIAAGGWDAAAGYQATNQLLDDRSDVTAVFASTMMLGVGALRATHERGVDVPADLSIICLHDDEMLDYTHPPLTTVRMPLEQLGVAAVDELLSRIDGDDGQNVLVPGSGELVERGSVASPDVPPGE